MSLTKCSPLKWTNPPTCTHTAVQMIGRNLWEISIKLCLVSALCLLRPYENIFNRSQYWLHIFLTGGDCVCFDTMELSLSHVLIYANSDMPEGIPVPFLSPWRCSHIFPCLLLFFSVSSPQPWPLNHICSFLSIAEFNVEARGLLSLLKLQVKKVVTIHKSIYFFCHG